MLHSYLAKSQDFSQLDSIFSKKDLSELNFPGEEKNCALALINNEMIPDSLKCDLFQKLLNKGLKLTEVDPKENALDYFSSRNNLKALKLLVGYGADISLNENAIFKSACWNGQFENAKHILEKAPTGYVDQDDFESFVFLIRAYLRDLQVAEPQDINKVRKQYTQLCDCMLENSNKPEKAATSALWYLIAFCELDDNVLPFSEHLTSVGANPYIIYPEEKPGIISTYMCAADYAYGFKSNNWSNKLEEIVDKNLLPTLKKSISDRENAIKVHEDMIKFQTHLKSKY